MLGENLAHASRLRLRDRIVVGEKEQRACQNQTRGFHGVCSNRRE
jgi:hypothetical protein